MADPSTQSFWLYGRAASRSGRERAVSLGRHRADRAGRPQPADGRRVRIHLTDEARRLEPTLKAIVVDLNAAVLEGLTPRQQSCFMGALRRVIDNTEVQLRR
jgi:hypothetical protein